MVWFLPLVALYVPPIAMIIAFIIYFWKILVSIFSIIPPIMEMAAMLLLNPTRLANEIITGVTVGIVMVFRKAMGFLNPAKYGPDVDLKSDENPINNIEQNCYSTSFMNLVLLIICPPFAIFQAVGFSFNKIFICTLLTIYGYYFPGLLYAIIITNKHFVNSSKSGNKCIVKS